jgi:hypothetical protein
VLTIHGRAAVSVSEGTDFGQKKNPNQRAHWLMVQTNKQVVCWLLGLLVYSNQRYLFEKSLNNLDCVRFIGLFGLFFHVFFPCVLSINQINRFISPCVLSLDSRIVSGLLVYLVYRFICPLFIFSMRSLNKPNKPVYFSMHSLTGQWDSVRFIGLFFHAFSQYTK